MAGSPLRLKRLLFAALLVMVILTTLGLGVWQVERLNGKLALIAAVNERAHSAPVAAPGPAEWHWITAARDAYRRVKVSGRFDHTRATRVAAVTGLGEGDWLLTPLRTDGGWTVLVNRGFVPKGVVRIGKPAGRQTVTGLLRVTEPDGILLRANDPAADRWYSRDVAAIAQARGLHGTAPYFIDADAVAGAEPYPLGGLTIIHFRNPHLGYAITWFALAVLAAWGLWLVLRRPVTRR